MSAKTVVSNLLFFHYEFYLKGCLLSLALRRMKCKTMINAT